MSDLSTKYSCSKPFIRITFNGTDLEIEEFTAYTYYKFSHYLRKVDINYCCKNAEGNEIIIKESKLNQIVLSKFMYVEKENFDKDKVLDKFIAYFKEKTGVANKEYKLLNTKLKNLQKLKEK